MRRECRERFPRHRLQRKQYLGMHHGTCVTHVPWCMSGLLTRGGGENVHGIPGACATRNFTYVARGPCLLMSWLLTSPGHRQSSFERTHKFSSSVLDIFTWINENLSDIKMSINTMTSYILGKRFQVFGIIGPSLGTSPMTGKLPSQRTSDAKFWCFICY